ncbi:hypothetical protein BN7_1375 [Wickerhamomyces ciferrii]|uniref:Morphogenetic regulator of filamentous growth protein 1 n=1 Tax=Wickerhamomyces ciferrii (strain ATCC 14091 / BCRC 22168 / CBS 111 / JCM 3599 / NBRC 0793 / NRRL Y-1031 F-60-10) TaxID=1206466 RepID=K0KFY9_WICCF|nr:uncharacterized protein BN7_1375 [Wickerhamomyces ciferrii]CCH41836.1 hypothetical protein BN7_1375 [Wickerhamomyces ciferrii]
MSTKKAQKINPMAKSNGSQASTPNGSGTVNIEESQNAAPSTTGANQNPLQINPQQQQIANGNIPMMNNMSFNPNFKNNGAGVPGSIPNNTGFHPQQMAAFQAQAHFANLQQDPSRNNPQYQQYLQQLQQQNQMFLQMQQNQQQQQQHLQHQHSVPGFQGQIPQQVPPQFQQPGQNQNANSQHPAQAFPHAQSQQPTPLQQHQQQPQVPGPQTARPGQIPTPQQTHPTQTQPTPQQPQSASGPVHSIPTPQQHPQVPPQQQDPQQNAGSKPDQPKLSRMPSVSQPNQIPHQHQMNASSLIMNRTPQAGTANAPQGNVPNGTRGAALPHGTAQGAAQAAQAAQSGMNNIQNSNPAAALNPSMMNVINFRRQMSNLATLKFLDFCELIGVRTDSNKNILYWRKIITDYFSEIGVLRYSVKSGVDSRQFEFSVPIIPRFFFSIIQSGVTRMDIQPDLLRTQVLANGTTYLESSRCCFTHYYSDGSYVNIHGNIRGILNQNLKLDYLDFQTHVFIPGVEWPSLEKILSDEQKVKDIFLNQENNKKADNPEARRLQLLTKFRSNYKVFHSMSNFGLQESVMRVMQVSDVMAHLKSLMLFSITSEDPTGPLNSLDAFVNQSKDKQSDVKEDSNSTAAKDQDKDSPLNMAQSPLTKSGKTPSLDLSQSTLTKRRRKSTVDNGLSPKSTADSPKSTPTGNPGKSNKKAKR